ncbi:GTPase-associated protein 1-related protein [Kitasatospora sp. NPDC002965]|uniref:GTPase-associated protein 1-related protein n=1 Tax=Kitasatospora sp. NPDC002965 TaxID=3154775 RepID=UPI0033B7716D
MPFQQLYYTSCEQGLSGFAGYQFNAVSADVSAGTMREVEALTAYEPPASLLYAQAPEELARCPVNLVFVPGATALAARVQYVGRDSSQRFGNYFAHALTSPDFARDAGGLLGIELWGSPVWSSRPADRTRLPALDARPGAGPLTPRSVGRFLASHPHAALLPALLEAARAALAEDRSVLVVDTGTDRIAHWFAAVCFLLPPPLARRLSFATYLHRPGRGRLHLIGSLPENRIDLGPDDQDVYYLFDFVRGLVPALPVHPLTGLLARVGPSSARAFWSWADDYLSGRERTAEDWHGPAAAAATAGGTPLTPADLVALIAWLTGPEPPPAPALTAAVRDVHRQYRLDREQLRALGRAAARGDDRELAEQLLDEVHESDMLRCEEGDGQALPPVRFTDPVRRARVTGRWLDRFRRADAAGALRLLGWASAAGLRPPSGELVRRSAELTSELLGATVTGRPFRGLEELLTTAARQWPELRQGLVHTLGVLAESQRGQLPDLLLGLPPGLLREEDVAGHARLLEHFLVARAHRSPELAVATLRRVVALRGPDVPLDLSLLHRLWPPRTYWSYAEALAAVPALPPGLPWEEGARRWLGRSLIREITDDAGLDDCLRLYELLADPPRSGWPDPDSAACVARTLEVRDRLDRARTADQLAEVLDDLPPVRWPPARALLLRRLPRGLAERPVVRPDRLAQRLHLLTRLSDGAARAYLQRIRTEAARVGRSGPPSDTLLGHLAAAAGYLAHHRPPGAQLDLIVATLHHAREHWPPDETDRLARALRPYAPAEADLLERRSAERRSTAVGRVLRWMASPLGTARRTPADGGSRPGGPAAADPAPPAAAPRVPPVTPPEPRRPGAAE